MTDSVNIGGWGNGFQLGDAANYALIAFCPHNFHGTANSPIYGNLGVGPYSGIQLANDHLFGNLVTTGAPPVKTGGTVTGSITGYNWQLNCDISQLKQLSVDLSHEQGTVLTLHSGQTIEASCGTWDCHGNLVFTLTNWADNITIHGADWQHVVFNVQNGVDMKLSNVHLSGGLTINHVLFNDLSTKELHGVNNDTFEGTVLAPYAKVNVDGVDLEGHLFGGACGQDFQWVSGAEVHSPPVCDWQKSWDAHDHTHGHHIGSQIFDHGVFGL